MPRQGTVWEELLDDVLSTGATGRGEEGSVRRIVRLAYWLDERFRVPGTNIRVGIDGLLGLIPGIGDTAGGLISAYILAEAWRLGVPRSVLVRMLGNLGVDVVVGAIPVLGDVFDIGFKANRRNVSLLVRHLERARPDLVSRVTPRGSQTA